MKKGQKKPTVIETEWYTFVCEYGIYRALVFLSNVKDITGDPREANPTGAIVAAIFNRHLKAARRQFLTEARKRGENPAEFRLVLDNAAWHKPDIVNAAIEDAGFVRVVPYPPYSSDLNPIENLWHMMKVIVHAYTIETLGELKTRIKEAFDEVRKEEKATEAVADMCRNWMERVRECKELQGHKTHY